MRILPLFPPDLVIFLSDIEKLGFSLCLVGGSVRDFLRDHTLSHDLDFEIRPSLSITDEAWPLFYSRLHEHLKAQQINFSELPYLITRANVGDFDLEFSSPRIEAEAPEKGGHHHFEATLIPTLSYQDAFKRRDLSLNAIGMEINFTQRSEKLIDPYGGSEDLKQKKLKNLDDYFFLDPVRFLRLVRFCLKYDDFSLEKSLREKLSRFDLSDLSNHHLKEEMAKSKNPGAFLDCFNALVKENAIKIPARWDFFKDYSYGNIQSVRELLVYLFLRDEQAAMKASEFFSLPKKEVSELKSFYASFIFLQKITHKELVQMALLPQAELLSHALLKEMKNLEDKKEWWRSFSAFMKNELTLSWKDWENITVEREEMEALRPESRSYYRYYKALKQKQL